MDPLGLAFSALTIIATGAIQQVGKEGVVYAFNCVFNQQANEHKKMLKRKKELFVDDDKCRKWEIDEGKTMSEIEIEYCKRAREELIKIMEKEVEMENDED